MFAAGGHRAPAAALAAASCRKSIGAEIEPLAFGGIQQFRGLGHFIPNRGATGQGGGSGLDVATRPPGCLCSWGSHARHDGLAFPRRNDLVGVWGLSAAPETRPPPGDRGFGLAWTCAQLS